MPSPRPIFARLARLRPWPELVLLAVSLGFAFLLAEGILRLHYVITYSGTVADLDERIPPPGSEVHLGDILELAGDRRLVYRLKPGLVDVRFRGSAVSTSSQGFRERQEPEKKGPRTVRILGIGDSVMFGQGVEESERYMDVLERLLNERLGAVTWETITLAVPGYNLVTELAALEHFGLAYDPDLILYGYVPNDSCLPNFVGHRRSIWRLDSFVAYYLSRDDGDGSLVQRSAAMVEIPELTARQLQHRHPERFAASFCSPANVEPAYKDLVGERSFMAALDELVAVGREAGVPVVFFNYGRTGRTTWLEIPQEMTMIDLHDAYEDYLYKRGFASFRRSDLVLSPADPHPSKRAHRLIGSMLFRRLREEGLLSRIVERYRRDDA